MRVAAARKSSVGSVIGRLLTAVGLLALAGCQAGVETTVKVQDGTARATVSVSFQGQGLELDQEQVQRLAGLMTKRAGNEASVKDDGKTVVVDLDADSAGAQQALTGVKSVVATPLEGGWYSVAIEVVIPNELIGAVAESVNGQPDAEALKEAALGVTEYSASVSFDEVREATFSTSTGVEQLVSQDGKVKWSSDLAEPRTGVLVVVGREVGGSGVKLWALGLAVLLMGAIVVGARRR
jgi:hypothetical protein